MILGPKKFWTPKIRHLLKIVPGTLYLKFGPNRVSDSWDIAIMDKCH